MSTNLLADIFRIAERHDVTVSLSYSKPYHCFKVEIYKGDLRIARYFNGRDLSSEEFITKLIQHAISEIEQKEKERKND